MYCGLGNLYYIKGMLVGTVQEIYFVKKGKNIRHVLRILQNASSRILTHS
jgi:hypothetical protein